MINVVTAVPLVDAANLPSIFLLKLALASEGFLHCHLDVVHAITPPKTNIFSYSWNKGPTQKRKGSSSFDPCVRSLFRHLSYKLVFGEKNRSPFTELNLVKIRKSKKNWHLLFASLGRRWGRMTSHWKNLLWVCNILKVSQHGSVIATSTYFYFES